VALIRAAAGPAMKTHDTGRFELIDQRCTPTAGSTPTPAEFPLTGLDRAAIGPAGQRLDARFGG
jgi:hypothetical protein